MFYEKKVRYLNYLVKQERLENSGFVKIEVREGKCSINITVNVPGLAGISSARVYLASDGREQELCTINLAQKKVTKQLLGLNAENIGGTGIAYRELEAIRIPLLADRELYTSWEKPYGYSKYGGTEEKRADGVTKPEIVVNAEKSEGESAESETAVGEEKSEGESAEPETAVGEEKSERESAESETAVGKEKSEGESAEPEIVVGMAMGKSEVTERENCENHENTEDGVTETFIKAEMPKKAMLLYDNKWKQLWEIYPHISPFQDEREYLSIGPGDFVILPQKYFRMANNSFLLHGYYNYRHLVLKRLEHHGESRYYMGVPGNFYDREKQVAVMFGFESFEGQEEPARTGDYGYYFMRVEL